MSEDEETRQLQVGQAMLDLDAVRQEILPFEQDGQTLDTLYPDYEDREDRESMQRVMDRVESARRWMLYATGYTKEQAEIFAMKAAELNHEVANAERAAGWDPNP